MMSVEAPWQEELRFVVNMMRDISREADPQHAALLYGRRIREGGLLRSDAYLALSRRGLTAPEYRITRSSTWKEAINPWQQQNKLPLFSSGLLSELIYSNEPAVIEDLPSKLDPKDPAYEYLKGMKLLLAAPHFDDGEALNMGIVLVRDPTGYPMYQIPNLVLQANLWGRSVRNLVLRQELTTAYEALDRELTIVGQIQQTLLPTSLPSIPGLELGAHYQTARHAGGDYYDFFPADHDRWGIFIADVSGHGSPAAVIMAITHAIAHLDPGLRALPGKLLSFINHHLAHRYIRGTGSFVTAFYGLYDANARTLTYARAGHNPTRLLRKGVACSLDNVGGLPLGIFDDEHYTERTEPLNTGDLVLFYTDGITEARNKSGEMFGVEGLDAALAAGPAHAQAALDRILSSLGAFTDNASPSDDRTLLSLAVE